MAIVVQKYGGSSVADLDRLGRVADRIAATRAEGHQVVAVVSAMGNTTNELLALARDVSASPNRRELDMLVSVGERISMSLLAIALRERGVPARSLTGSQSGIITDEAHADARVVEVRPARLLQTLEAGDVAIVAGFQGVSRAREVTTLGRGGSDTTAVVLAAALGAGWCEICSDVDGVYSADPRRVPEAIRLDTLSLDEALALAQGGAKVLFEDAVRYARDHGVEIRATHAFGPGAGTRLVPQPSAQANRAAAVTCDDELVRLTLDQADAEGLRALREAGLRLRRRVGDEVYLDPRNAHGSVPELAIPTAIVSAVGARIDEGGAASTARVALHEAGVDIRRSGSEGSVLWWEVSRDQADEGVRVVHRCLNGG